ncbi:WD40-repeat-containing domain protein [Fimicolochytrium jonesii]|uniref:WD40-repeat-containing domain protein n=1 Tax=Fimicolochytrium jonesii TaxID=1396493 RepID=UPI0022FF1D24|nr:WD40-repeat-containing domain protein [Fimicolochytrium jonesii]KAI8818423.1 WD40-repeat-containing domain protein [Fimicolochytrium jonesii]
MEGAAPPIRPVPPSAAAKRNLKAGIRSSGSRNNLVNASQRLDSGSVSVRSRAGPGSMMSHSRGSQQRIRASQEMQRGRVPDKVVQVLDEDGNDVTPLSLLGGGQPHAPHMTGARKGHGTINLEGSIASTARETVADVLNNLESMTQASWNASMYGRSGTMGMSFSNASRMSGAESMDEDDTASAGSGDSGDENEAGRKNRPEGLATAHTPSHKPVTEADLIKPVNIELTETATIFLLDIPSTTVSTDFSEEATAAKSANERYAAILAAREGNENFVSRSQQTFNDPVKTKEVQAVGPKMVHAECMVTQWEIFDATVGSEAAKNDADGGREADIDSLEISPSLGTQTSLPSNQSATLQSSVSGSALLSKLGSSMMMSEPPGVSRSVFLPEGETVSDVFASVGPGARRTSVRSATGARKEDVVELSGEAAVAMLNQESLRTNLRIMERAVVANNLDKKLLLYRDVEDAEDVANKKAAARQEELGHGSFDDLQNVMRGEEERAKESRGMDIPTVDFLWSYRCELTRGRAVTFMEINKENEDIIAVAYGDQKPGPNPVLGLVLCWNVKNPEWPERIYRSAYACTSLSFSNATPNLLACGYINGAIQIYDIRHPEPDSPPLLTTAELPGRHRDPVWELQWVERERAEEGGGGSGAGEWLISVGTEGRVVGWTVKKGLESVDLMSLKRVAKQSDVATPGGPSGGPASSVKAAAKPGSFIARQSGGLCFDFSPKDPTTYIVGTDDNNLHRCSPSYNEQYLQTYMGHTGPVNRVRYSPFLPGIFLSCSSDWTARLWKEDEGDECIMRFQGGKDTITDIAWSPAFSTVFGCVSTDGRMEIWDLQFSVLDPVILHTVLDRQLTTIVFAHTTPVVLTGDDNGSVNVYKLKKLGPHGTDSIRSTTEPISQDAGFNAIAASAPSVDVEAQASLLRDVIAAKNQGSGAAAANANGAASTAPIGQSATASPAKEQ